MDPTTTIWYVLVSMTQLAFLEVTLPEELTWTTIVLLNKGQEDYRGIEMV